MTSSETNTDNNSYLPQSKKIVRLGEIVFTKNPDKYHLLGIGTCIGVYMYDLKRKMYLMAHTVLPEYCAKRKNKEIKRDDLGRYTDLAIRLMVKKMRKKGSKNENIRCKIVGGGKIYNDALDIGKNNIKWAKKVLDEENIKLVSEDLGGKSSRSILSFEKDGVLKLRKNGKYYEI